MTAAYEQFSLVFNLLMAAGAGGFGDIAAPRLFGQSLLIAKETYLAAGGHAAVRGVVLENLRFAGVLRNSGARSSASADAALSTCACFLKAFTRCPRAGRKPSCRVPRTRAGSFWLRNHMDLRAMVHVLLLIAQGNYGRSAIAVVYLLLGLQLAWIGRKLGSYSFLTCLLYPLPLAYYCFVFGHSAARRALGRKTVWRGREV